MKRCKKYFALLLAVCCFMSLSIGVLAAESAVSSEVSSEETRSVVDSAPAVPMSDDDSGIMPMSIYGYAADYTDYDHDTFTVNASGSSTSSGSATLKTSDFGSSTQIVYVSIYRPDGTLAKGNIKLTGNQEVVVSFSNAQSGNYTVAYTVSGTYKGWIHCWIY